LGTDTPGSTRNIYRLFTIRSRRGAPDRDSPGCPSRSIHLERFDVP